MVLGATGRFWCNGFDLKWIQQNPTLADPLQQATEALCAKVRGLGSVLPDRQRDPVCYGLSDSSVLGCTENTPQKKKYPSPSRFQPLFDDAHEQLPIHHHPKILKFQKPTVAAVNGHATAAGAMLLLSCDVKIANEQKVTTR